MAEPGVAPGTTSPAPEDRHDHTVVSAQGNYVAHVFESSSTVRTYQALVVLLRRGSL